MAVAIEIDDPLESVFEGSTSWLEGFRQGRQDGFEIGLKLGLVTAIKELERLIEKNKNPDHQIKLAEELREKERQLDELGFVRKCTKND